VTEALSFDFPSVSSVGPPNLPTTGGKTTTISGAVFSFSDKGRFEFTSCEVTDWVAFTSIQCRVAAGVNTQFLASVVVTMCMAVGSLSEAATYDAPISALTPSNVKPFGNVVLVMGVDLGLMDSTLKGRFSSSSAEHSNWVSDTTVVCLSPSGISTTLSVFVTVSRVVDALSQALSYDGPSIAFFAGHREGVRASWSVAGKNFGVNVFSPSSRLGFSRALTTQWQSDSSISCQSASGHPIIRFIAVTSGRSVGSLTRPNFDVGVVFSAVMQSTGPSWGGSLLQLAGKAFGLSSHSGSVRIGHSASPRTEWVSESIVVCKISPGSIRRSVSASFVLTIRRARFSLSASFSYDAMSLSSVQASNLRSWSTVGLSVIGASWGESGLSPRVRVGASDTLSTVWVSDTFVLCRLSPGYNVHPQIVATLSRNEGTLSQSLSYDLPSILFTQAMRSQRDCETTDWTDDHSLSLKFQAVQKAIIKNSISDRLGTLTRLIVASENRIHQQSYQDKTR